MRNESVTQFLTRVEVARTFQVNPTTVSRWAQTGRLRGTKTPGGRRWLFRRADVEAFLSGDPINDPQEEAS